MPKFFTPRECDCGSHQERRELLDARGIFCTYICDACEERKRGYYRADIFTDPDYWHDEPIEEED